MSIAMSRRPVRRVDPLLALPVLVLFFAIGLPTLYSATQVSEQTAVWAFVLRQASWFVTGLVGAAALLWLDERSLRELSRVAFVVALLGLVAVLVFGRTVNGAKSWIAMGPFSLQPSEFAKLALILAMARLLGDDRASGADPADIFRSALLLAVPSGLVLLQPDLGTVLTFIVIWLAMLWWANARPLQLLLIVGSGLLLFAAMWHLDVLADYQKSRITVLLDPDADPRGQGYNLRQSLIAVSSGGLTGKGYLQGTQTHLGFLPEKRTDFIFGVLCEEGGMRIALAMFACYLAFFWRAWGIVGEAETAFSQLTAVGCTAVLLFHVVLNAGMVIGVIPITGLPLPFVSYGGSHLVTCVMLVALLMKAGQPRSTTFF